MGIVGKRVRSWVATSHPESPGIEMSLSTMSIDSCSQRSRPLLPSLATMTTYPASRSMSASTACTSGSSSMMSTRAVPDGGGTVTPVTESGSDTGMGRRTTNVLPSPGALSTSIVPPWRGTMPHEKARAWPPSCPPRAGPLERPGRPVAEAHALERARAPRPGDLLDPAHGVGAVLRRTAHRLEVADHAGLSHAAQHQLGAAEDHRQ